jgi:hypothetical protein
MPSSAQPPSRIPSAKVPSPDWTGASSYGNSSDPAEPG